MRVAGWLALPASSFSRGQRLDISLDFVVDAARRRLATLTPEVAGYVVLLAARELELSPRGVSTETLALAEGGEVHVRGAEPATPEAAERALRGVLATLVALAPSPAPAISAVAERADLIGPSAFAAELAAALIPINHAAAQRALARLYRESQRARQSGDPSLGAARARALDPGRAPPPSRAAEARSGAGQAPTTPAPDVTGPHAAAPSWGLEPLEIDVELDTDVADRSLAPLSPAIPANDTAPEPSRRFPEPFALAPRDDAGASSKDAVASSKDAVASSKDADASSKDADAPRDDADASRDDADAPRDDTDASRDDAHASSDDVHASSDDTHASSDDVPRKNAHASTDDAHAPKDEGAPALVALTHAPSDDARTALRARYEPEEPVGAAPVSPTAPAVVVPMPIIGLPAHEQAREGQRQQRAPMTVVDEPVSDVFLAEPTFVQAATEPRPSIETFAQDGFPRVSWPSLPPLDEDLSIEDCRSDVQQLLASFIADRRSEERMTRALRQLLGLEPATSEPARPYPL